MSKIIGLTGGIATGKSTVSKIFKEAKIPVIDTDVIAKQLLTPRSETFNQIIEYFGEDIITTSGEVNRNKLAQLIFNDEEARAMVNAIIHPKVKERVQLEIKHFKDLQEPIIVVDVPLLFETNFHTIMDKTVLVYTQKKVQIERLMARDMIDKAYAIKKIESQMPLREKRKLADYVIDNSKSILSTKKAFNDVLKSIQKER